MPFTRDQIRGQYAYSCVLRLGETERDDYKILVNAFGPNVVRSGLAAAVAFVDRDKKKRAAGRFLEDLAASNIPGIPSHTGDQLLSVVQRLEVDSYMLATREVLRVIVWFKRAIQATSAQS